MKNENPLEKVIEAAVCKRAKELGILAYKFTSPAQRHVPDRLMVCPHGRIFFMEMKRLGEQPTPGQAVEHAKLRERGATVYVVDSAQKGKEILQKEIDETKAV